MKKVVCVSGAGGFLASWLVKLLLNKGYTVHGTLRDPSNEKNAHLMKLEKASENLKLFKADLLDYEAIESAIVGCEGVFHVASPAILSNVPNPEEEIIAPAVTGTLNVLKACSKNNITRVIVVSSLAAVGMNPSWPQDKLMDEESWSDAEYCRKIENWYCLSKTLAEREAVDYGVKHGLDVVTVCPCWVLGPLLQANVNESSSFIIDLLKGNQEVVDNRVRHFVDVRDVADALLLVYEKPEANGRYICAPHKIKMSELVEMLKKMYPHFKYPNKYNELDWNSGTVSDKLKLLGWKVRSLKETLTDSIEYWQEAGVLDKE